MQSFDNSSMDNSNDLLSESCERCVSLIKKENSQISEENENCLILDGLKGLMIFSSYPQFSVDGYVDTCMRLTNHKDEDIRVAAIKSIYSISCSCRNPETSIAISVLFNRAGDSSKKVRKAICEEFPDKMISLFSDSYIVSLTELFIDDKSCKVAEQAIRLVGRIKKYYPLNVLNIFWQRLVKIDIDFFHTDLIRERKRMIMKLPWILEEAKEFAAPLHKPIIQFIKKILLFLILQTMLCV